MAKINFAGFVMTSPSSVSILPLSMVSGSPTLTVVGGSKVCLLCVWPWEPANFAGAQPFDRQVIIAMVKEILVFILYPHTGTIGDERLCLEIKNKMLEFDCGIGLLQNSLGRNLKNDNDHSQIFENDSIDLFSG